MKVSVVMATFNGGRYLKEQLGTLAAQIRPPDELIISDDGSNDETKSLIREFSLAAPFEVRVLEQEVRLGYARNFATAAMRADGDLIFFCDQDDLWFPEKIQVIEKYFIDHKQAQCVVHDITIVDGSAGISMESYFDHLRAQAKTPDFFVKGCASAIRRSMRDLAFPLPANSRWTHDSWSHALAHAMETREVLARRLIFHRIHGANTSGMLEPERGFGGRLLARIEWIGLFGTSRFAKAMLLGPAGESGILLQRLGEAGLPRRTIASVATLAPRLERLRICRREVQVRPSASGILMLLVAYFRGDYRRAGGAFGLLADLLRGLNFIAARYRTTSH